MARVGNKKNKKQHELIGGGNTRKYFYNYDFWATSYDTGSRNLFFAELLALIGWIAVCFLLVAIFALLGWLQ